MYIFLCCPQEERMKNMTQYNVTYDQGELAGAINDSPHLDLYMIGYVGLTLVLVLTGAVRSTCTGVKAL